MAEGRYISASAFNGAARADQFHTIYTIQYNTIQYNTIQYNTIQYNTIQYNTIQYNTIRVFNCVAKDKFLSFAFKSQICFFPFTVITMDLSPTFQYIFSIFDNISLLTPYFYTSTTDLYT